MKALQFSNVIQIPKAQQYWCFKKVKPLPQSTVKALLFSDFQNPIHKY